MDRKAALKARHRQAIVAAARSLLAERNGPDFSVDDLAARADIARRTVFNHFGSLDDVVLAVCTEEMQALIDKVILAPAIECPADVDRSIVFEELVRVLRDEDMVPAIARIVSALGGAEQLATDSRAHALVEAALTRTGHGLFEAVARRAEASELLEVELLVGTLMGGLIVIAFHWIDVAGARVDAAARQEWRQLLDSLVENLRNGYGTHRPAPSVVR